jgi:hypothetical protein
MTFVKKTLLSKGVGRYEEKTATVQDGSGLPYLQKFTIFNQPLVESLNTKNDKICLRPRI